MNEVAKENKWTIEDPIYIGISHVVNLFSDFANLKPTAEAIVLPDILMGLVGSSVVLKHNATNIDHEKMYVYGKVVSRNGEPIAYLIEACMPDSLNTSRYVHELYLNTTSWVDRYNELVKLQKETLK